ncbi:LLM class flavin-dependent oxidoreductase [Pseudonocardia sp. HH130629-09]|uniref:LLM class flavin-dependent oxidoreductase n=1 Tax=Pseudonocardia sp. HH130629-09 TaxID=1641402 RepID=UPI00076219DD|nr:LLM class flavin-dependent oxidoreductase [Pseudonocardia sp. HH130629-09]
MDIAIALPGHVPSFDPAHIPQWARAVEDCEFPTLAVGDRPSWSTPEPLTALAAAAAATTRIGLLSSVLLAPVHTHAGLFATAAATVDRIAGQGRLRLGLAPGAREADYAGSPTRFTRRGKALDAWLNEVRATWARASEGVSGALGPAPVTPGGPPLLFGGEVEATVRRVTRHGVGWIGSAGDPAGFAAFTGRLRAAFTDAGRSDSPQCLVSATVALTSSGPGTGVDAVGDYYADFGPEFRDMAMAMTVTTPSALRDLVTESAESGADGVVLTLNDPDPASVAVVRDALTPHMAN